LDILFYYCKLGKQPRVAKIRQCCAAKGCPHLSAKPRKRVEPITLEEEGRQLRRKEKRHAKKASA
jgi:hypothetical protein